MAASLPPLHTLPTVFTVSYGPSPVPSVAAPSVTVPPAAVPSPISFLSPAWSLRGSRALAPAPPAAARRRWARHRLRTA